MAAKSFRVLFPPAAIAAACCWCCVAVGPGALAADPPQSKSPEAAAPDAYPTKPRAPHSATPPPGKSLPGPQSKLKGRPDRAPLALGVPKTPAEREKALSELYAQLAAAEDEAAAQKFAGQIERLWLDARSDTVALLMERGLNAAHAKNFDLSLKLLDAVVELQPDYAEGWNRRAYVHFLNNDVQHALGDLRRVLALDPNHFKALDGLVQVLRDIGEKKAALAAMRTLLEVHPYWKGAKQAIDELARDVEGRGI